jgi:chromosome segregation ATPase
MNKMSDEEDDLDQDDAPMDTGAKNRELDALAFSKDDFDTLSREFESFLKEIA